MVIKVNNDLFLIKRITSLFYEQYASLWNEMSDKHKSFKKENKMFFCEQIDEAQIDEAQIDEIKPQKGRKKKEK